MAEQIVDIIEATMPASSDVVVAARSAGGAAGLEAGRTAASELAGDMRDRLNALVFCQIFVGRFGVSFSPFERLFLGRFGFGQSCGLSVIA